ncbi:MAG: V4R domain-containing protein [Candidatus Jordarchaeum sp.]|uniref:V4R domain-containing protein n=1 Tax=Candidatus Jordarchaeum sp. TaxID=2823881 RepID=UPI00404B5113
MKFQGTGVEFVDRSLGPFYRGLPIMFSTDSATANDAQRLANFIALNILEKGGGCVLINENLPFFLAINETLFFDSPEKRFILQEAINKGRLYYLNIVFEDTNIVDSNRSMFIKSIANDLNIMTYEIINAKNQIKKSCSDIPVLILLSDISSLILGFKLKEVLSMIRKLILNVKRERDFFLGILNREMQEQNVTNSFTHFADYVLEFGVGILGGKRQPYVSVNRTPFLKDVEKKLCKKFAYEISEDNFYTIPSLPTRFEELRENISYFERGEVTVYGTNYIISEMHTFVNLLKEIEKKFGKSKYSKMIERVGKALGSQIAKALSSQFKLTSDEVFKAVVNHLSITGWGKFNVLEGDTKTRRIRVEGFSRFATNYGKSDLPVCIIEGSILKGVLEELTSLNWTFKENECVSRGNRRCEFELESV